MSRTEAISCKLPLLDGDNATNRPLRIELEPGKAEIFRNSGNGDIEAFNDLLCVAWGLVLRCYTGQNNVSFHFQQNLASDLISNSTGSQTGQSLFRIEFDERENLSTCCTKARASHTFNQRREPFLVSTTSESDVPSPAGHQNTLVWVQHPNSHNTFNAQVQKVRSPRKLKSII